MGKNRYESPRFEFQEMRLLERVAAKCWGMGEGWVDADGIPGGATVSISFTTGGCQGQNDKEIQNRIDAIVEQANWLAGKLTADDVNVNTKGSQLVNPGNS